MHAKWLLHKADAPGSIAELSCRTVCFDTLRRRQNLPVVRKPLAIDNEKREAHQGFLELFMSRQAQFTLRQQSIDIQIHDNQFVAF